MTDIIHYRRSWSDERGAHIFEDKVNLCATKGKFSWKLAEANCPECLQREAEMTASAKRIVEAQAELNARLNSPDPAIRAAAEKQVIDAGVAFIMDTRFGGP